jgi:hypothetical protein
VPLDMPYRCYFLDREGHLIQRQELDEADDAAATRAALALGHSLPKKCAAIELWDGDRLVINHRPRGGALPWGSAPAARS